MKSAVKKIFPLIILLVLSLGSTARAANPDSLAKILSTMRADSNKINTLFKFANELSPEDSTVAMNYANEMLKISEKLGYEKGSAKAWQTMGQVAYNSHSFKRAIYFLEKGAIAFEKCNATQGQLDCNFWLACCYRRTANYPLYQKYLSLMEKEAIQIKDQGYLARTYEGYGNLYRYLGQYPKSIENYVKAIDISEKNGKLSEAAVALNNLSLVYGMMGKPDEELKIELRTYKIVLKLKDSSNMVLYLSNLSNLYQGMKKMDTARSCINLAMNIIKRKGEQNINFKDAASVYEQFSSLAAADNDFKTAVEFQNRNISLSKKYGDIKTVATGYSRLADIFIQMKNKTFAEEYYLKSLEINKEIGFINGQLNNYASLQALYKSLNNSKKEQECERQLAILTDSVAVMTNSRKLAEAQALVEIQAQQEEIILQEQIKKKHEAELKNNRSVQKGFIFFCGSVALLLAVPFFLFRYERRKN